MSGIKALCFDVFGTVVDWRNGVAREASAFFLENGIAHVNSHRFADAWRSHYQPAMQACRSGGRPFVRLDVLHRENLELALAGFQVDPASLPAAALDALNLAWHRLDPWPDVPAGLKRMKHHFIIAPASNGNIALQVALARRGDLPWDAILGAEVTGFYKPEPEAYLRLADILGLAPEEVCMVAAHNDDLAAARACGLRTAFVLRPAEHGPGQTSDLTPSQDWDFVSDGFMDLAAQLTRP